MIYEPQSELGPYFLLPQIQDLRGFADLGWVALTRGCNPFWNENREGVWVATVRNRRF